MEKRLKLRPSAAGRGCFAVQLQEVRFMIQVFNTLTNKKEEFKTMEPNKVRMYVCGPTVYNFIHIGNARPICVFDVFRRFLTYSGYDVTFVQNFTDIDDKMIRRANEEGITVKELAEKLTKGLRGE